jgi:hypothetical protein
MGGLIHPQAVDGDGAKILIHSHASLGRSDHDDFHRRDPATPISSRLLIHYLKVFDARICRRDLRCIFAARAQSLKRSSVSMPLRNIFVVQSCVQAHDRAMRSDLSSERNGPSEKAKPGIVPIAHARSAHVRKKVHFGA